MHAPTVVTRLAPTGLPASREASAGGDELSRARDAVAAIGRVRDQLAATQRSLEAFIARTVAETDEARAAGADRPS